MNRVGGGAFNSRPESLNLDLLGNRERVIKIDAEIPNSALDLGMPQQELDSSEVARSSVNHRCLGSPSRVCAVGQRIEPDCTKPGSQQTGILARGHRPRPVGSARKKRLALVQALLLQPVPDSLVGVLRDLELHRSTRLPLRHGRRARTLPFSATSSTRSATKSQARRLLAKTGLNSARSRTRWVIWSLTRLDQIILVLEGWHGIYHLALITGHATV